MIYGVGTGSKKYSNYFGKSISNANIPGAFGMRTSGQCKISEKELVGRITELAHKDAAAGKDSKYSESLRGVRYGSEQ